ncbi:MAG: acetate uptake transporter [Methanosarcinaceae archaeon]|nr:acetate uptake transporter [Methanosarcinaceae archaeon]MDD4749738.1 acetate uptake transporter [Methanosarcinaceae archaeon]
MNTEDSNIKLKDLTGNPAPLGLMGFGMTTVLLNLHNAGFFALGSMILSMGIFYGGIAQIIAGIMEWKKGNTFGTVAFTSYGAFWLSLVGIIVLPVLGWGMAPEGKTMAAYLFMWGLFTLFMFVGTLKAPKSLQLVFFTLTLLFFLLALGDYTGNVAIGKLAGYEGILCGFTAIYTALGQVINEAHKKTIFPLG